MPKASYPYEVNGKLVTENGSLIPICSLSNRSLLPSLTVSMYFQKQLNGYLNRFFSQWSGYRKYLGIHLLSKLGRFCPAFLKIHLSTIFSCLAFHVFDTQYPAFFSNIGEYPFRISILGLLWFILKIFCCTIYRYTPILKIKIIKILLFLVINIFWVKLAF